MSGKKISRTTERAGPKSGAARVVMGASATAFHREMVTLMRPLAHAERAGEMSAYMRGQFAYLGIPTPQRRKTAIVLIRALKPVAAGELRLVAEALWRRREREYQYIAVDLLMHHCAVLTARDLPWLLELAQKKAWWDTVDSIVKVVGRIVRRDLVQGQRAMDRALRAKSFWVRRIAMLHQLGWREETDVERLFAYADQLAGEKEFFIRKAIGWALRDFAWHDPIAVRRYLDRSRETLSALTLREAGKHC
jgi:3-methyladenine DNA glycosylase AlkD